MSGPTATTDGPLRREEERAPGTGTSEDAATGTGVVFVEAGEGSPLRKLAAVAVREYRVVHRSRFTTGIALLFAVLSTAVVLLGGSRVGPTRVRALVVTLAELSTYLVPLAALASGYGTIVTGDERGSLDMLLVLPVSRGGVLVGKYVGRAAALAAALVVGLGVGGVALVARTDAVALVAYVPYALAAVGVALAFLAVAVLVSAAVRDETRALGGVLLAWVWFVLVHDLLAVALVAALDLSTTAVAALVLANPAALLRVVVRDALGVGGATALSVAPLSLPVASLAIVAWVVVPIGLAAGVLRRRAT